MANFIICPATFSETFLQPFDNVEHLFTDAQYSCCVCGSEDTYHICRNGEDAIASIGYVCHVKDHTLEETLTEILISFQESLIGDLKKKLIGQYLLLIKKGQMIYLFSDFMGARNIFYSDNGKIISSSFSIVEDFLQSNSSDLNRYKVLEFLAMRHILYPAWLGHFTMHKRINWLLPYEYLVIDTVKGTSRIGSIVFSIDNQKQSNRSVLSYELLRTMRAIINRMEYKDVPVAASLSGGRDSRLVAAIAAEHYSKIRFRIAYAPGHFDSLRDMKVAKKLAQIRGVPLDVYQFQPGRDEGRFFELTEGFTPTYNNKITAVIDNVRAYSIGLGGVFGTELFMPIVWTSIDNFVQARIEAAKRALQVEVGFWKVFRESLYQEFQRTRDHFQLSNTDERDYIRLFLLLDTARYASFILSAFNRFGYQLEPYGTYDLLDLSLRVAPDLWGSHRRLGGNALVQQAAMAALHAPMASVLTYKTCRPMLPLSATSFPLYLLGFTLQTVDWARRRFRSKFDDQSRRTILLDACYVSDGWESQFVRRTQEKYGLPVKSSTIS